MCEGREVPPPSSVLFCWLYGSNGATYVQHMVQEHTILSTSENTHANTGLPGHGGIQTIGVVVSWSHSWIRPSDLQSTEKSHKIMCHNQIMWHLDGFKGEENNFCTQASRNEITKTWDHKKADNTYKPCIYNYFFFLFFNIRMWTHTYRTYAHLIFHH